MKTRGNMEKCIFQSYFRFSETAGGPIGVWVISKSFNPILDFLYLLISMCRFCFCFVLPWYICLLGFL